MKLELVNDFFNNLKKDKSVQNFIEELSEYSEKSAKDKFKLNSKWNNLISNDLTLYNKKIISKYRDKMLIQRANILQNYAESTKELGKMYYIYNINDKDFFNICICEEKDSHQVIAKQKEELPEGATLGSVLRKLDEKWIVDNKASKIINEKINIMINEKIEEQNIYLNSKRIDGHIYEVSEKYFGRIWLYDLNNPTEEGIEEIEFPQNLYETAKQGDLFVYKNGKYYYLK